MKTLKKLNKIDIQWFLYIVMWRYIAWPLKYFMIDKVARLKKELQEIEERRYQLILKGRRVGLTETIHNLKLKDEYNRIRYMKFIERWDYAT